MNEQWSARTGALVAVLALWLPAVASAQLGVSLGGNAARPVPNAAAGGADATGAGPADAVAPAPAVAASSARISRPSQPMQAGQAPEPAPTARDTRMPTSVMGMSPAPGGAPLATTSVDLGGVLNTGSRIQRDNASKICPPGLVNRNNFCAPPASGAMTR